MILEFLGSNYCGAMQFAAHRPNLAYRGLTIGPLNGAKMLQNLLEILKNQYKKSKWV